MHEDTNSDVHTHIPTYTYDAVPEPPALSATPPVPTALWSCLGSLSPSILIHKSSSPFQESDVNMTAPEEAGSSYGSFSRAKRARAEAGRPATTGTLTFNEMYIRHDAPRSRRTLKADLRGMWRAHGRHGCEIPEGSVKNDPSTYP